MSEIVNLNKARKARSRDAERSQASENRVKFGRTKAQKAAEKSARDKAAKAVDGARREP
jgi:hypothetical protein